MGPATNVGGRTATQHRARVGSELVIPSQQLCHESPRPSRQHLVQALEVPCESHVRRRTTRPRRSISFPAIAAGVRSAVRPVGLVASNASRHISPRRPGLTSHSPALRAVARPVILRELLRPRLWHIRVDRSCSRTRSSTSAEHVPFGLHPIRVEAVTPETVRS